MQTEQELQNLLYEKMSKEQDTYIEKLKHSKPEEIISAAYEKVMRDDILMLFSGEYIFLDKRQLKELLRLEYPLSACYDAWMDTDCSHTDMLRDTVDDFTNDLVKETEQTKKKKRQEPER